MAEQVDALRRSLLAEQERLQAAQKTIAGLLPQQTPKVPAKKKVTIATTPSSPNNNPTPLPSITNGEFESVPKYIKGRITLDKINNGVDFFNQVVMEKYAFMRHNPAKLGGDARQRYYDLKGLENEETAGRCFVTEHDLKAAALSGKAFNFKMDNTGKSILAILRHCGRIKEYRSSSATRYVIL